MATSSNKPLFPLVLWDLLDHIETNAQDVAHILSWQPDGTCFRVHNQSLFETIIQKRIFIRHSNYGSFRRQLNLWGFERIKDTHCANFGAYAHPKFQKGQRELCCTMIRPRKKNAKTASPCGRERKNKHILCSKDEATKIRTNSCNDSITLQATPLSHTTQVLSTTKEPTVGSGLEVDNSIPAAGGAYSWLSNSSAKDEDILLFHPPEVLLGLHEDEPVLSGGASGASFDPLLWWSRNQPSNNNADHDDKTMLSIEPIEDFNNHASSTMISRDDASLVAYLLLE